jgi:hypothetical protein
VFVPDEVGFAVKTCLVERMTERALPAPPEGRRWAAADEVDGRDGAFRDYLGTCRLPYAVTVQAGWRNAAAIPEVDACDGWADC